MYIRCGSWGILAGVVITYSLFQKDLQSGLGLKRYEDKGKLDNKVHRMAC